MTENAIFLEAKGIIKEFSGVRVLNEIDFNIRRGEVHSLLGENGAGKSTLIKIITGIYQKDGGMISIKNKPVEINSRQDSIRNGIAVVYQEFSLMPSLTVAENVQVGREEASLGFLKKKQMKQRVQTLIDKYGFDLKADATVADLGIAECQMVEFLKALSFNAELVIMDEPTSALSTKESEALFAIIDNLRNSGVSILYISHRLDEVYRISDRITVLRDGGIAGVYEGEQIRPSEIVRAMVGKEITANNTADLHTGMGDVVLSVRNFTRNGAFRELSFDVHAGEILGIAGLVGSGRTEMLRSIFGIDPYTSGTLLYRGKPIPRDVRKNIASGIGFITEDRRHEGFVPHQSIEFNVAMVNFDQLHRSILFDAEKSKGFCENVIDKMRVKPADNKVKVGFLSGGNQQKVVVGKWLFRGAKLLLIDEPTVGVDIGAKEELYTILEDYAREGAAILLVSSDNQELLRVATRIIVFSKGRIVKEFNQERPTQEDLLFATSNIVQR